MHRKTKFEIYAMFQELFDRETIRWTDDGYIFLQFEIRKFESEDQKKRKMNPEDIGKKFNFAPS